MKLFKELRDDYKKNKYSRDVEQALSYIKNNVIIGRGESMSAELLLTELADLDTSLSSAFEDMASALHVNDKEKASQVLFNLTGEGYAKDLGQFLAGWEDVPPSDLLQTVEIYAQDLREERRARIEMKDELISDLIYMPVVMNAMLVLLNFVYVAFFIQQRAALEMLF